MTGAIPSKFTSKMIVIPKHFGHSQNTKGLKYAELLTAIDAMDKERAIQFTIEEFEKDYGKSGHTSLRAYAKKAKVKFILRLFKDKKNVTIWKNDKLGV